MVQQVEWYKPWSQGEQLVMIEKLPDPYKDPTGFYKGIQRIQHTYDAVWTDLSALVGAGAGMPLVGKIKKVQGQGIEPVPTGADTRLKKIRRNVFFKKRLEIVTKELNSELGTGLPEAYQASVDEYHARITSIFKDQDFDVSDPDSRDARILRTCFINGLREDLMTELMKVRPECMHTSLDKSIVVIRSIEKQLLKRKKKQVAKQPIPVFLAAYGKPLQMQGEGGGGRRDGGQMRMGSEKGNTCDHQRKEQ